MGYIQSVDHEALLACACRADLTLRMEHATGEFVAPGRPLVSAASARALDRETIEAVHRAYAIGAYRTIDQDPAFGLRQLVDIALKALSPGINDTTTAVTCIEHLSVLLGLCAGRAMPGASRGGGASGRLIVRQPDFADLVALAFGQILESARGNTEILLRLLATVEQLAPLACNRARIAVLGRQVEDIRQTVKAAVRPDHAMRQLERAVHAAERALAARVAGMPGDKGG